MIASSCNPLYLHRGPSLGLTFKFAYSPRRPDSQCRRDMYHVHSTHCTVYCIDQLTYTDKPFCRVDMLHYPTQALVMKLSWSCVHCHYNSQGWKVKYWYFNNLKYLRCTRNNISDGIRMRPKCTRKELFPDRAIVSICRVITCFRPVLPEQSWTQCGVPQFSTWTSRRHTIVK